MAHYHDSPRRRRSSRSPRNVREERFDHGDRRIQDHSERSRPSKHSSPSYDDGRKGHKREDVRRRASPEEDHVARRERYDEDRSTKRRASVDESRHHGGRRRDERGRHDRHRDTNTRRDDVDQQTDRRRDRSKDRKSYGKRDRSRSPDRSSRTALASKRRRRSHSESRSPPQRKSRAALPPQAESYDQATGEGDLPAAVEKQKPNFESTGLLAKEANTVQGTSTVLKYHEPPEGRKPASNEQWRMYIFKDKDMLDTIPLYERSCWLMGRDQAVADLHLEHPSISKQHAVIQFRYMPKRNEYGDRLDAVKPYLIDLESANSTRLNGKKIQESRFVELQDGDVVSFGDSQREYVMMLPPAGQ